MFNKKMNNLRGIAIILVIVGHSVFKDIITKDSVLNVSHLVWGYDFIYTFHMPLFFFISGFFAKKLFEVKDYKSYKNFIVPKLLTIGVPYITFSIIGTVVKLIMSKSANNPVGASVIIDIIAYPWNNPLKLLWFMYTLMAIFTLLPLLNRINIKIKIIVFGLLWCMPLYYGQIFNMDGVIRYSFFVLVGYAFSLGYEKYENSNKNIIRPLILTFILILLNINPISTGILQYSFELICSFLAIISLVDVVHVVNTESLVGKTLSVLGKYSFDIYLIHWFLQMPIRLIYQKLGFNYNVLFVTSFVVSFVSIPISKYIIRKVKVFSLICFGKDYSIKKEVTKANLISQ